MANVRITELNPVQPVPAGSLVGVIDGTTIQLPMASFINRQVVPEIVLFSGDETDQEPPGLDDPLQVLFGDALVTPQFDLDALGNIKCLEEGAYTVRFRFLVGRTGGAASTSNIFLRAMLNSLQLAPPVHAIIDNQFTEIPLTFEGPLILDVNDVLTVQMVRDSSGNDSGGLYSAVPTTVPWGLSPSAVVTITRDST